VSISDIVSQMLAADSLALSPPSLTLTDAAGSRLFTGLFEFHVKTIDMCPRVV